MSYVFTYWEGPMYPFTELCLRSVTRIFGDRHIHLGPDSVSKWADIDENVLNCNHISFKSDYIRTVLLQKNGGWWFDSDILLFADPSDLVTHGRPEIWNLIYRYNDEWVPLINNGILYTPPKSEWINLIVADFQKTNLASLNVLTSENEDIGQNIYEKYSVQTGLAVIGSEYDFNSTHNVNADYRPYWDGTIKLNSANYGIHIGASLSRWAIAGGDETALMTLTENSLNELVRKFPLSVVSQYLDLFDSSPDAPTD